MAETEPQVEDYFDMTPEEEDGMCECGKTVWNDCDCGVFFLNWVCGFDPSTGYCSMAGTEDCDWECPRMGA